MCGRYMFSTNPQQVTERFSLSMVPPDLPTRYNVAPQMFMPVIVANSPNRLGFKTINARAETVAERPAYRAALRYHRCLVPANGFYEWRPMAQGKQPYFIHLPGEPLFAFAGLYEIWHGSDGSELRTYTIITCGPNQLMAPLHNRMPVILPRQAEAAWLDPEETRVAAVLPLLQPFSAEAMEAYPVSTAVNSPGNDGPALIAPLSHAH